MNDSSNKRTYNHGFIKQARKQQVQIDWLRTKFETAEKSEFTNDSKEEISAQSKALLDG
ncbi:CopG family transcriptional regulator [Hyunsoonleella rubra]|uniref:CopG family transcriptional regulator n=1 Tax=Hyunsoonleella rubra TaxID=1737062 RepID=A0ABW5T613_9FLAO